MLTPHCLRNYLGLILNTVKSILAPSQHIEFTGALLDSTRSMAFLLSDHFQVI